MHYFEYATKDTTLYEVSESMNTGLDEILEIRKDMNADGSVVNVSRALIKFDLTYISKSVASNLITSGSKTKFYLNLYDASSRELNVTQTLYGYPVSQSWDMGSGRAHSNPIIEDGASWKFRDNNDTATPWYGSYTALQGNTYADGTLTINEGDYNNQEVTIGGVDFTFVAPTIGILNNSSTQIFVASGSTTGSSVNNLRNTINNTASASLHGLPISASFSGSDSSNWTYLMLSGSSAGTNSNLTAASSSGLFVFSGGTSALAGGTDTTQTLSGGGGTWYSGSALDSATATITISDYTELNAGDKVNLIAADGTNYDFTNGDQSSVNGTWESATSNNQTATNLMNVINTSSGPAGTRFTATVAGAVVTATQATAGTVGNTSVTLTDSGTAGMTKTNFSGGTWSEYGYVASQSFTHEPSDLRMDVTDITWKWLHSTVPNEGFMIKRSGSMEYSTTEDEGSTTHYGHFLYFGRDTHTVYQPKLEVVWDDSKWTTGSLSALSNTEVEDMVLYMRGFRPEYKETSKVKFRVVGRARYPEKSYSTSGYSTGYTTAKYLPSGSTYYEIKDAYTEDVIVPFGSGSVVSCDSTGNYFNLWMDGLQSERFYRINYKVVSGSGTADETVQYFDEKHSFKVVR